MSPGVAVTGMGIISAIGNSLESNLQSLRSSTSGLGEITHIATKHAAEIKVGEVSFTNAQMIAHLGLPELNNYSRTALLGVIAAKEAIRNAGIVEMTSVKTGLISATTVGGMDLTEQYLKQFVSQPQLQKYISAHQASDSTQKIAEQLGIKDFVTTISTACSSSANAIMLGARMIKAGKLDRVIVGGTDSLAKFTINGFKTLMILSDTYCKPFDANRTGLNLGEAAAYLVLESDAIVQAQQKKVWAYVSGYGNANDAFHQTASSPTGEGAFLSMQGALELAGLQPNDIDYVNAHGTATANNDLSESIALQRIFLEKTPDFSSTKPFTGHTLAAAGAVEAVYSILALQHAIVFPNLNFSEPMPETGMVPSVELQQKQLQHVLSNSFGFGGNCSSLIFTRA
ncbi:beta-ketoacyl-[acyl-carrier-protein] synthase family protein [Ulvibacter sp. MAR_2010_11]|uniref:beta-ketoacyl-[acyl-carrier-protein] synthase family protein n=1 Tax=Ulvibacter sp. MAR_2010_11 TaxID=1250229 RepID=UPI0018E1F6BC|nr:beta-ketoacyl-[acyl-carrier-protein] synthase family protein [Ulvibacter sp. MAR_2010_11]